LIITAELKDDKGQLITVLTVTPKEFNTGSKGFYGNTKIEIDGKRYQTQIEVVEIGSKTKAENPK
jgi:hypothetical protein